MVSAPPLALLVALQVLHALSFGATHLGTMQFLSQSAPEGSRGAAQGDIATANSLMMAAASALAGVLYGAGGATAYAAMAALAAAGGGFSLVSMRFLRTTSAPKSGERRVGEEGRSRGGPYHLKKKHIRHDDR